MKRLMLVAVVVLAVSCDQTDDAPEGTAATGGPTGTTATTSPPSPVSVPDVTGEQTGVARGSLADIGLSSSVTTKYSGEPKGVVLRQTPGAGREVDEGTEVELVVAQPLPRIPNVTTKNLTQARRILRNAASEVAVTKRDSTTQRDGDIVSQRPSGGTEARPGRTVTLVVIHNVCTPGYTPCLRKGPSDYDCYGGTGNGPAYTEPGVTYRVTGFDPYDLDGDSPPNGYGCE